MGRPKKKGAPAAVQYDSDDERAYEKEERPDPKSEDYFMDEIDQFHSSQDKVLLDTRAAAALGPAGSSSDEEAVLDVDSDEEDEEIEEYTARLKQMRKHGVREKVMLSDDEDEPNDKDGKVRETSWGLKKYRYYGGDVDKDDADLSGDEPETAALEEEEALAIQKRMAEELDEADFGLDILNDIKKPKDEGDETEVRIEKDLSKLSRREKLELLQKESPELIDLLEDYKSQLTELQDRLLPLHGLIKDGTLPPSTGVDYIKTKVQLSLNYCVNLNFYLMLKAKLVPIHDHPVIQRLVQYRQLLKQLESVDKSMAPKVDELLKKIKKGEKIKVKSSTAVKKKTKSILKKTTKADKAREEKRKLSEMLDKESSEEEELTVTKPTGGNPKNRRKKEKSAHFETEHEKDALEFYDMLKAGKKSKDGSNLGDDMDADVEDDGYDADAAELAEGEVEGEGQAWEEGDGRRAITRMIEKNVGLKPVRKKENRNPRVKHRNKYRKALIRRKGQVRTPRTEMTRYGGELSGIRAGVKHSTKLK